MRSSTRLVVWKANVLLKKNPSEIQESPKDSVQTPDTVFVPEKNEMAGKGEPMEQKPYVSLPLKKIQINSKFGMRKHPIFHKYIMHNGVDLSARYENVYSMFPGTVIRVGEDGRSGKFVTVRTGGYTISYCHLSQQLVKVNDYVYAGSLIAVSGNTGASTGPHLHITAKKDGKAFNPAILLNLIKNFNLNQLPMQ